MEISFVVYGEPRGKARPRVTRNGTYTPDATVVYEELVRARYREAAQGRKFNPDEEIEIDIKACYNMPKSASSRVRNAMLNGKIQPKKKPDIDNIIKIICDALNGIAYRDDAQVVKVTCVKEYGNIPQVDVTISHYLAGGIQNES